MLLTSVLLAALQAPAAPLLVSTQWVAERLQQPGLVLFQIGDASSRPAYTDGHIPGAQFLNPFTELAAPRQEGALFLELPSSAHLDSVLEARGVTDNSHIVLYMAQEYFSPTTRALWTLEWAGLAGRVSIMDGGLERWKAEGRPVSTEVPTPAPGRVTLRPNPNVLATADWIRERLDQPAVKLIDARSRNFYNGAETRQGRNGRIPGAASIPFTTVVDSTGLYLPPASLREMLTAAGAPSGGTVVTYCHIGQQATVVWFAARLAGFDAKLYDGSFQEWARRTELPVQAGQ